jgi:7,8-dihydroneopterin aldolase/epimerase/oxygenase
VTDTIELRGLRVVGRHGVLDEEHLRAQPFEVDLDLEVDLRPAGRTDALADTVDYGAVTESVAGVIAGEHSDLLEHLAERIARAAFEAAGAGGVHVETVTVTVRKLRPPVPFDLASAGVRVRRGRADMGADGGPSRP